MPIEMSGKALSPELEEHRADKSLSIIGRLKPGVTADQARGELQAIAAC